MSSETTIDKNGKMTFKKSNESGNKKSGCKPVYIHKCSEKEVLNRLSEILVGNGHPEDGLAFRFKAFMIGHEKVLEDIVTIKDGVAKLNEKVEANAKVAVTAQRAIEKFKLESEAYDAGLKDAEDKKVIADNLAKQKKRDAWQRVIWIIMAILGLTGILLNNIRSSSSAKKIDNLQANPVIENSKGVQVPLIKGDTLRVVIKDFKKDVVIKDFKEDTTKKVNANKK